MSLASNITEIQAPASAATGESIRPYCTVALAEGSPAEAVALGWYDDEHGEYIEYDGLTILGPNHYSEVLRPEARPMPSQDTTFTVVLFEPTSDDEFYETGYNWKRTNKTKSFTVTNTSGGGGGEPGEEDESSIKRWVLIAGAGLAALASVIGIGMFLKKK
jgi:hypothetical protein